MATKSRTRGGASNGIHPQRRKAAGTPATTVRTAVAAVDGSPETDAPDRKGKSELAIALEVELSRHGLADAMIGQGVRGPDPRDDPAAFFNAVFATIPGGLPKSRDITQLRGDSWRSMTSLCELLICGEQSHSALEVARETIARTVLLSGMLITTTPHTADARRMRAAASQATMLIGRILMGETVTIDAIEALRRQAAIIRPPGYGIAHTILRDRGRRDESRFHRGILDDVARIRAIRANGNGTAGGHTRQAPDPSVSRDWETPPDFRKCMVLAELNVGRRGSQAAILKAMKNEGGFSVGARQLGIALRELQHDRCVLNDGEGYLLTTLGRERLANERPIWLAQAKTTEGLKVSRYWPSTGPAAADPSRDAERSQVGR